MHRRWLFAGILPLVAPAAAREPGPMARPYNRETNTDLIRLADLDRAQAALELLPPERWGAARANLAAERQSLVERIAKSLAI